MVAKKRILTIAFSDLKSDPRVNRQLLFLKSWDDMEITAAGFSDPEISGIEFIKVTQAKPRGLAGKLYAAFILMLGLFRRFYWANESVTSALRCLGEFECDIILANDLNTLPVAVYLARRNGAKIFLDCHEYTPREFDDKPTFRLLFRKYWGYICTTYLAYVDVKTTVCESIAQEYKNNYGGNWEVITNAPFFEALKASGVSGEQIRMVHHGAAHPSRKLEKMIQLVGLLDEKFKLDFMLINHESTYAKSLMRMAERNPSIRFREPVRMIDIVRELNQYDIGLCLIWPKAFNYEMALPNKLFEFVQARLAVATWPSPEMAKIVRKYGCGVVSDDYSVGSMAKCLNQLSSEDIMLFKEASNKAAAILWAETNMEKFNQLVNSLLASSKDSPKA